ncbi:MAG: adenine deaminase [Bacillota bacterium]
MNVTTKMAIASGKEKAETVFKNARLVNVFTGAIERCDIAVQDGMILGVGDYHGKKEHDLKGKYVAPGFIDGHVHIESSMVTPAQFGNIILPKGTTTVIADPHEIANIAGEDGIRYMLKSAKKTPLDVFMMVPSSVPATTFETSGATIDKETVERLRDVEGIHGLGEVMNYPDVVSGAEEIHAKIKAMEGLIIDGHAPGLSGYGLSAYVAAGVMTDHECFSHEALLERVQKGMYVHLREGSVTRNVEALLPAVNPHTSRRLLFCTDDKHPEDIAKEGHINYNVNLAIDYGIDPIEAIRMATLNAAECYGLKRHGAIAPNRYADFIVFSSLEAIEPIQVYKKGRLVAYNGRATCMPEPIIESTITKSVHIDASALDFRLKLNHESVKVIGLIENNITTTKEIRKVRVENGLYVNDPNQDILKLAVVERHKKTGNIGLGLVEGFGFKNGALAMTIAHDSHNLIVTGDTDEAMEKAVHALMKSQGGIALVDNEGKVTTLPLEVGGIMTTVRHESVAHTLESMKKTVRAMGLSSKIKDPFIQLAFLSLPVIPALKLTDKGLFDVDAFDHTRLEAGDDA